ncbi:MAG: AI-2E family transporter [Candidatus Kerfeldbacteria bacterium]|nr:AI-2E family transporter [Candidatus Kerfeldbacteria bacterium]
MDNNSVTISTNTILKILVIGLAVVFLYQVREVLAIVFVSLVLAAAIDPSITRLEHRGIPRAVGIAVMYIALLALLSLIVILLVPLVADQLSQFTKAFPQLYAKGFSLFQGNEAVVQGLQNGLDSLNAAAGQITKGFFTGVVGFFGGVFTVISILVLTFYLTMEEQGMKRVAIDLAPVKYRPYLTQLFRRIEERLGMWLRGQLTLGLIIAIMTYIGLTLLHVKYALILALIAGVTELLPIIGPIIGAIPAVIVGLSQQPILGLWVTVLYLGIQQLENHLIVPRVMAKATGLNPVIVIVALLVAAKIAGLIGVILAIPVVIMITTFLEDFLEEKKAAETKLEPVN